MCETAKGDAAKNEDRLVITDHFVAVVDGASSSLPFEGVAGGVIAAECVAEAVREAPADATAPAFVAATSRRLAQRIGDVDPRHARPSAAVVVYSVARDEVWRVGDCHFRIDDTVYPGDKPLDDLAYGYRCAVLKARLSLGLTSAEVEARRILRDQPFAPLMEVQHAFANLDSDDPLAYGTLDGQTVPARFVEIFPAAAAREIVLSSDGFPRPPASLAEGLRALDALRRADPLLIGETQGSRPFASGVPYYDDTTYIRLAL